jgi:hypothetical protein
VEIDGAPNWTPETVAEQLRRAKGAAKAQPGYSCMLAAADGRLVDLHTQRPMPAALEPRVRRLPAMA